MGPIQLIELKPHLPHYQWGSQSATGLTQLHTLSCPNICLEFGLVTMQSRLVSLSSCANTAVSGSVGWWTPCLRWLSQKFLLVLSSLMTPHDAIIPCRLRYVAIRGLLSSRWIALSLFLRKVVRHRLSPMTQNDKATRQIQIRWSNSQGIEQTKMHQYVWEHFKLRFHELSLRRSLIQLWLSQDLSGWH